MAFTTNDFRGEIHDPINVTNSDGVDLYASLRNYLSSLVGSTSVPMSLREDTLKSGGFLFGSRIPLILISHPDPSCKYFSIGKFINDSVMNFQLFGRSEEQYKYNLKEQAKREGNFIKQAFYKPDELKIQQESRWESDVLSLILDGFFA